MKIAIWTATVVVILASAMIAWMGFNSAHAAHAALADEAAKHTALANEISRARARVAPAERDLTGLSAALNTAQTEATKRAAAANSAKASPAGPPSLAAILEVHPELRGLFKQNEREKIRTDYRSFFNAARITPEQRQKFADLMIDNAEEWMDLQATSQAQGLSGADPAVAKLQRQMDEKLEVAQKELLGPAAFQQLQDLKRLQPRNEFVSKVVDQVALTSDRFTDAQQTQLLNVLATNAREGAGAFPNAEGTRSFGSLARTTDLPRVIAQAQTFLSPLQVAALKGNVATVEASALIREYCLREGIPAGK